VKASQTVTLEVAALVYWVGCCVNVVTTTMMATEEEEEEDLLLTFTFMRL
jgi:hypothetical protein